MLIPEIRIDAKIHLTDINPKLVRILNNFEPFGPENMTPVFASENVFDTGYAKTIGQYDEHLKLFLKQSDSEGFGAIGFGIGEKLQLTKNRKPFEIAYCIDENEYKNEISIQLRLKDLK
jgi:single-stranded-DNA-specific exonuclease